MIERIEGYKDSQRQTERGNLGEKMKACVCVQTLCLCTLMWEYTRERSEKENAIGRQGCKGKKMRTKGRTERWWCCVGALVIE